MRADVVLSEDTTNLFVRWEIVPEAGEADRLERLDGPLALEIETSDYVDEGGKHHERAVVEVPIHPHPGRRSRGQARFRDHEARRRFVENLQGGVSRDAALWLWADGSGAGDGKVIRVAEWASAT